MFPLEKTSTTTQYHFLQGGGEMGELTRHYNWATTLVGTPDTWPQSLRTTLSIILNSKFPMFLFWGQQHLCFYNDAYRPSLGNEGKHPLALGQPGAQVWPEIWEFIKPFIDQALSGGGATWREDQLLPIYRNGQLENVYWTFSYSPVCDESGSPAGVFVTCAETTDKVLTLQQLQDSHHLSDNLFNNSVAAQSVMLGKEMRLSLVNDKMLDLWGRSRSIIGLPLMEALPELKNTPITQRLLRVYTTGESYNQSEERFDLIRHGQPYTGYYRYTYDPLYKGKNEICGVVCTTIEITQEVLTRQKIEESELQSRSLVDQLPVGTILLSGEDMIITRANEPMLKSWGTDASVIGKPLLEVLPELKGQDFGQLLADVYATGTPYTAYEAPVTRTRDGLHQTHYYDLNYQPMRTNSGTIYGVLSTAVDVTSKVMSLRKTAASEARFRSLIEEAPIASCLFTGPDMVVGVANKTMLSYWGKGDSPLGKPLQEGVPELMGQPFLQLLDQVYTTGETYTARDAEAQLVVDGVEGTYYFDFTYKALRDEQGVIYGVMDTAVDVTEKVAARQQLESAEADLRSAINLAELGTWSYDVIARCMTYSQRMLDWYGFEDALVRLDDLIDRFDSDDKARHRHQRGLVWNEDGLVNDEHTIINRHSGQKYIIHSVGKPIVNEVGQVMQIVGASRDVTLARNMQRALESQVKERTEELEAINKDFTRANIALETANYDLTRSNQNLEQFAYIASHDLQEPLRKIQQFGDLLQAQYATSLGEGALYLDRIQSASSRMSILIKDLLSYSRITTGQQATGLVPLVHVMERALTDLELVISETGALVTVELLPTVAGDASQLGQLFFNLLSNALKFRSTGQIAIRVSTQRVAATDLPPLVKPARLASTYHRIDMSDNGIGFEGKYVDRIFEVFQRLHGKNEFAGTGIGLAICQKVAANHGGAITASSQPGQGAIFSVYLPI